jgi:hypothetical protein
MTKAQQKTLERFAMRARRTQQTPDRMEIDAVLYYIHPTQHNGVSHALQRGPGWYAQELERIVAADRQHKTPVQVEDDRVKKGS